MKLRSEEGLNIHLLLVKFELFYVITVFTCTQAHTHKHTHIYPLGEKNTELLGNGDQITNCMQDVKQGSHPLLGIK